MKNKLVSLHGEVKSFRKAAEDRLEEVFFVHPEYRQMKTAKAVEWMIDRVKTNDYPFSTKGKSMEDVWHQVLQEKRDKMVEAIEATEKPEPIKKTVYIKHGPGQDDHDHSKFMTEAGLAGFGPGQHTQSVDPELPADLPPSKGQVSVKVYIERLRADIKAERAASKIARELKRSPFYVNQILKENASEKMKRRSVDVAKAFSKVSTHHRHCQYYETRSLPSFRLPPLRRIAEAANAYEELKKTVSEGALPEAFPDKAMVETMQSVMDASQGKGKIVADASIVIREGKFFVEFSLDITLMARMYIAQHGKVVPAIDSQDQLKITFS